MKIAVIGTGYVGLVTATCLAESGNDVVGIDKDARKIQTLEAGQLPIYEPGLLELVARDRREGRLTFSTNLAEGIAAARLISSQLYEVSFWDPLALGVAAGALAICAAAAAMIPASVAASISPMSALRTE